MKQFISLLIAVQFCVMAIAQNDPGGKKIQIYLLAGQSNMAGRGTVEAIDTLINPHIWMLNKNEQWVPAREPLAFDKPKVVGVGPGFAFANALQQADPSVYIYLVPSAVGGSRIDLWQPGAYDSATRRVKKAMPAGELKGIIWHQGESDCNPKLSGGYEAKLTALIKRFRSDLGNSKLPFVAGEIAHFRAEENPDKQVVNKAIRTVVSNMPFCGYVETHGLQHRGDSLHFDSPSAREIGRRYAAAISSLIK